MLQRQLLTGSGHPQCGLENMACKPPSETEVIFSSLLKVQSVDQIMQKLFMSSDQTAKNSYPFSPLFLWLVKNISQVEKVKLSLCTVSFALDKAILSYYSDLYVQFEVFQVKIYIYREREYPVCV